MKKIFAIMNEDMVEPARIRLGEIGITGIHIMHVLGKGCYPSNTRLIMYSSPIKCEIATYSLKSCGLITDSLLRRYRKKIEYEIKLGFLPKRMLVFTTGDHDVMSAVHTLMRLYIGWGRGKGKIFVCPVSE